MLNEFGEPPNFYNIDIRYNIEIIKTMNCIFYKPYNTYIIIKTNTFTYL